MTAMMKRFFTGAMASFMVFSLAACGSTGSSADSTAGSAAASSAAGTTSGTADRVLQLGHVNTSSDDDQYQYFAVTFANKLKEVSGGKLGIDIVTDSVLGGERDMMEGMQMGTVDMALITNFTLGSFDPEWQVFDLPYFFKNRDEAYSVLNNRDIMGPMEETLYNNCGVKTLSYGDGGFRQTLNNVRPINSAADLSGMKLRLPETAIYVDAFKAMGANPTTLAFSETFTAVEQGTVDGLELPISSIHSTGYGEICKYMSMTNHFYSPFQLDISVSVWESLSEEEQGWFEEAAQAATVAEREFVQAKETEFVEELKGKGLIVNEVADMDSLVNAATTIYDKYRGQIGSDLMDSILTQLGRA